GLTISQSRSRSSLSRSSSLATGGSVCFITSRLTDCVGRSWDARGRSWSTSRIGATDLSCQPALPPPNSGLPTSLLPRFARMREPHDVRIERLHRRDRSVVALDVPRARSVFAGAAADPFFGRETRLAGKDHACLR